MFPDTLHNKNILDLIPKYLNLSIEDFKNTEIFNLPLNVSSGMSLNFDITHDKSYDYKLFYTSCFFIENELKKIPNFNKYLTGLYPDFLRNIKNDENQDGKGYVFKGHKKLLCCHFINAPQSFINEIPHKLLDVNILSFNLCDKTIKFEFQFTKFKLDNNELSIKERTSKQNNNLFETIVSFFTSQNINSIYINYTGIATNSHKIDYTDDSIIYTVIEKKEKCDSLKQFEVITNEIQVPKKNYKDIIYKKIFI
jgi:hypothetical protein